MKQDRIIYWVTTIIIFIMEGIMPAFTSQTELAKKGISHLQYPEYFGTMLVVFKIIGALILILPFIKGFIKEWAYGGFVIVFISAAVSHGVNDGLSNFQTYMPLIFLVILLVSHHYYLKLNGKSE